MKVIFDGNRDKKAIKDVFAGTLDRLMGSNENVVYLDADLMNSIGTLPLMKKYPGRAIDCGIQEANMVGVAAGMAAEGKIPFLHTFGPFASRRVFDQAFLSAGYSGNSVRIFGSDPGVTAAFNGGTHMPFEDVAMYRTLPEAYVLDVCDCVQFEQVLEQSVKLQGVIYMRSTRKNPVAIYSEDTKLTIGKAMVLREGKDVSIVASGIMVAKALQAADELAKEGISATVIDSFTIKPLDGETILAAAKATGAVVTAENASVYGGLGSAVCELLAGEYPVPVKIVGVENKFGQVGDEDFLCAQYELTAEKIIKQAKAAVAMKK